MKKLLIIATGGTIASGEGKDGLTPSLTGEELLDCVPEVRQTCELSVLQLMNIDSTNMRPCHWGQIRDTIAEHYGEYDGFIVLHGTDTMAYTAAALSYMLQDSVKPIVLTGSQKSILHPYTDAKINLYQSILYALDDNSHDVVVVFNGKAIAGTRARKQRTRNMNGFESMNFPPLAYIQDSEIIRYLPERRPGSPGLRVYQEWNERIFVIKMTPLLTADIFRVIEPYYDALILEAFGIGGIPSLDDSFEKAIFDWVDSGKLLAITTQVPEDGCDLSVYQVGKKYSGRSGILETGTMTIEALIAKLAWILGQTRERAEVEALFYQTINYDRY
ncbi:MAG: asparaginase [Clostridiales bacterium]|nr:asparaginase [Clostridiales bacterium]